MWGNFFYHANIMSDQEAIAVKVLQKDVISPKLFSFRVERPTNFRFDAGQFVRLGIKSDQDSDERIFRAYSVVSSPYAEYLEFFSVVVPNGAFTSKLQHLMVGDTLYLNPDPFGFLTLSRFQEPSPHTLWLLATGTGIAPFLSILQDFPVWENYQQIVLVYSVSHAKELAYQTLIKELSQSFASVIDSPARLTFVPVVTKEQADGALHERLPKLIASGELERYVGIEFASSTTHVMLCGNPQMVDDTKEALKNKGLTMNRRGVGNIAVENYW